MEPKRIDAATAYTTASLVQNGVYRFKVYGINAASFGHFSLGMIVPNAPDAKGFGKKNSVPYIINVKQSYSPTFETFTISSTLTSGSFNFGFTDTIPASDTRASRTFTKTFNFNVDCATIVAAINYGDFGPTCVQSGNTWTITNTLYREDF